MITRLGVSGFALSVLTACTPQSFVESEGPPPRPHYYAAGSVEQLSACVRDAGAGTVFTSSLQVAAVGANVSELPSASTPEPAIGETWRVVTIQNRSTDWFAELATREGVIEVSPGFSGWDVVSGLVGEEPDLFNGCELPSEDDSAAWPHPWNAENFQLSATIVTEAEACPLVLGYDSETNEPAESPGPGGCVSRETYEGGVARSAE